MEDSPAAKSSAGDGAATGVVDAAKVVSVGCVDGTTVVIGEAEDDVGAGTCVVVPISAVVVLLTITGVVDSSGCIVGEEVVVSKACAVVASPGCVVGATVVVGAAVVVGDAVVVGAAVVVGDAEDVGAGGCVVVGTGLQCGRL